MLEFVNSPTEMTTAVTDLLLAALATYCCVQMRVFPAPFYRRIWQGIFGLLGGAALLGAAAHGLVLGNRLYDSAWAIIYLSLALLVALFLVAFVSDVFGAREARQLLGPAMLMGGGFFSYTLLYPSSFTPFIIYQVSVMLLALLGYSRLAIKGRSRGAAWLAIGIAVTIVASAIQATRALSFTLVWAFDHNGVYHLVQMLALVILLRGLRQRAVTAAHEAASVDTTPS